MILRLEGFLTFTTLLVLFHSGTYAASWYEDVWDTARDFISSSNLVNGALEGLRYAQMVDSALSEECTYECPRRNEVPVPKDHHSPSSNGCGSFGYLFPTENKDNWIYVEKEFSACCDKHDLCYDTCNADKDQCDLVFKKCLYAVCKSKYMSLAKKTCQAKAKMFFLAVIGLGCQSYKDAQAEACNCVKKSSKQEL